MADLIRHMNENSKTDGKPIIRLVDVHKSFPKLEVLKGVSLTLPAGETTVVIGESGAGKSVLLKHITGLLRPDRGEVYFQDQRIDLMREKELVHARQRFGFLFQLGALFDSLTVAQNVAFPVAEHTRKSRREIEGAGAARGPSGGPACDAGAPVGGRGQ